MDDQDFPGAGAEHDIFAGDRPEERFMTVKAGIRSIGVRGIYHNTLQHFVRLHHLTTMHTYRLLKYIILHNIGNADFVGETYINYEFISEVYRKLIRMGQGGRRPGPRAQERRARIDPHLPGYLRHVGIGDAENLPRMTYSQQTSHYEANKIKIAYLNNVKKQFGRRLRQAINVMLQLTRRKRELRQQLQQQQLNRREIGLRIRREITEPATRLKYAVSETTDVPTLLAQFQDDPTGLFQQTIQQLVPFFRSYPQGTQFHENNLYYDLKRRPSFHFKAFFRLAQLFERLDLPLFCVFPLRRSFIPGYVTIDTKMVRLNMRNERIAQGERLVPADEWGDFLDLNLPIFRRQGGVEIEGRDEPAPRVGFANMIQTDGVGVSVLKRGLFDVNPRPDPDEREVEIEEFPYIDSPHANLPDNNCVVIDPGRRDMLFCMREDSTPDIPQTWRFTKPMQDKIRKNRRYRKIIQNLKPANISDMERTLQDSNAITMPRYIAYLQNFGRACTPLLQFYSETRGAGRQHQAPIHRKLRLSAAINKHRCDEFLVNWLKNIFPGATFVMGNWSAPHVRYQDPIRGKGFRRLLQKNGLTVLLVDEYLTSKVCPQCQAPTLENFRVGPNPRPYRRAANPEVTVHGLLRCSNENSPNHQIPHEWRYWNRDLVACLNFIRILRQTRIDGTRPVDLRRPQGDNRLRPDDQQA